MVHRTGPGLDCDIRFHHDCGLYSFETDADVLAGVGSNLKLVLSDGDTSVSVNVIDAASRRGFEPISAPTVRPGSEIALRWFPSTDSVLRPSVVTVETASPRRRCRPKPIGWNQAAFDADGTMTITWPSDMPRCLEKNVELVFSDTIVQPAHSCDGVARCRVEIADVRIPPVRLQLGMSD
jgi:hypothetical protein